MKNSQKSKIIIIIIIVLMHYIPDTTLTDYMYQEMREEYDVPASKTTLENAKED